MCASYVDQCIALSAQSGAERDDQGRLVGFALTLRPTPHRFTVDGRTLSAWCASDTVILGRSVPVESACRSRLGRSAS